MDVAIRSLHLIAAAVWAGGLVFLGIAAGVARRTLPGPERIAFFRAMGRRFGAVAGLAALVLVATGIDMATDHLHRLSALTGTAYGHKLLAKAILFALALAAATVHSLVLGPRIGAMRERLIDSPDDRELAARLRRTAALSGVLSVLMLVATLAILVIAASLV